MHIESGIEKITFDIETPHRAYRYAPKSDPVKRRFDKAVGEIVKRMELADVFGELSAETGDGAYPEVLYSGGNPVNSGVLITLPPKVLEGHLTLSISGEALWRWSEATGRPVVNLIETALDLEDCKTTIEEVVIYVDYLDSHLSIDGLQWDLDDKRVNITRLSLDREGHKHREYTINLPRAESRFEDNRLVEIRLDSPKRTTGVHMRIVDVKAAQTLGCGPGLSRALDCGSWIRFELRLNDWDALDFQNHLKGSKFRADGELAVYIAGMFIAKGRFRIPYSDEKRRDFVYWYKDLVAAYDARSVTFSPRPMAFKIEDALLGIRRSECFSALNRVAGMYGRDVALELLDFVLGLPGGGNLTAGPFDWGEDDSKRYSDKFKDVNDLKQSIRDRARLFARCTQGQGE